MFYDSSKIIEKIKLNKIETWCAAWDYLFNLTFAEITLKILPWKLKSVTSKQINKTRNMNNLNSSSELSLDEMQEIQAGRLSKADVACLSSCVAFCLACSASFTIIAGFGVAAAAGAVYGSC